MLDKNCLKFDVYEYLKYCKEVSIVRGVGIITDKQYLFYSQLAKGDNRIHPEIAGDLENALHPIDRKNGLYTQHDNNAYLFTHGHNYFYICLPENAQLSMSQIGFIFQVLDLVEKYNSEQNTEDEKVQLQIFGYDISWFKVEDRFDIKKIKEEIKKMVTKRVVVEDEKIIGKTLSREETKANLVYHIGLESCTKLSELMAIIVNCLKYYQDNYYKGFFSTIFPDFSDAIRLIKIITELGIKDMEFGEITFASIKNTLINAIRTALDGIQVLSDDDAIRRRVYEVMTKEEISMIFPYLSGDNCALPNSSSIVSSSLSLKK